MSRVPSSQLQQHDNMPLPNTRHEAFAQRIVTGECLSEAYRRVYRATAKAARATGAH